jgi:hypothetical protein
MKLLSAYEDFVSRTLSKIPNALDRLRFIADMRKEGQYEHWGLTKEYGRDAAQSGIGEAHADSFETVLTTPIPELEASEKAPTAETGQTDISKMLPSDLRGGTKKHFSWIVKVISMLNQTRRASNRDA